MRALAVLTLDVLTTVARLAGPGRTRAVVAEAVQRAASDAAGA